MGRFLRILGAVVLAVGLIAAGLLIAGYILVEPWR